MPRYVIDDTRTGLEKLARKENSVKFESNLPV